MVGRTGDERFPPHSALIGAGAADSLTFVQGLVWLRDSLCKWACHNPIRLSKWTERGSFIGLDDLEASSPAPHQWKRLASVCRLFVLRSGPLPFVVWLLATRLETAEPAGKGKVDC